MYLLLLDKEYNFDFYFFLSCAQKEFFFKSN